MGGDGVGGWEGGGGGRGGGGGGGGVWGLGCFQRSSSLSLPQLGKCPGKRERCTVQLSTKSRVCLCSQSGFALRFQYPSEDNVHVCIYVPNFIKSR